MALYTFGGTPSDVLTTAAGAVVPDYPVIVRVAGTGAVVSSMYEADGVTPISQLRSNGTSSTSPGAIRAFRVEGVTEIEYEYNAVGGKVVRWYQAGREVPQSALQSATAATSAAASASATATTAKTTADGAAATAGTAQSTANGAASTAALARADAAAALTAVTTKLPLAADVANLPAIVYDAHRGGAGESPENTTAAYRGSMPWADVIDIDTQALGDGTPVALHDATVDRTTKSAGNVSLYNSAQWESIRSDPSTWFGAAYPDVALPTVERIFDEFGGRRVLTVEAKNSASVPVLAAMIKARKLENSVFINTNVPSVAQEIKNAGILSHLWRSAAQMATDVPSTWKNYVDLLDIDIAATDAQITTAVNSGIPRVWAHTLVRRTERDRALALGCKGIITDYPAYVSGKVARRKASTFHTGFWGAGYVPSGASRPVLDDSGRIPLPPPASSAAADAQVILAGELGGAPSTGTFDVKFSVPTAGSSGWSLLSFHLGADDDATVLSGTDIRHNGYTVQVSNNSSLRIYRDDKSANTSTQLANTAAGATLAANTVYTLRLVVTSTQLTLSVVEVAGLTTTVTDSTYRVPWHIFVGRNYNASTTGNINIHSISTP
ncbi:glycerophosphodiester phosphodiesterase [Streptomyces sp. NPDC056230]|uniref:glycerophosphodiester phosphodiesterase n=1 Tax=Streptomyces sp. NPDC056230 TaxID=3345754 RepID=UPI0035DADA98